MADRHGAIVWAELHVRDMEAEKAFYAKMAGWRYDSVPMGNGGDYVMAKLDGRPVAGFLDLNLMPHLDGVPAHWLMYVAVDDVDASVKELESAGGKLHRPIFDVPNVGRVAVIVDADGAKLALMTQV